MFLLRSLLCILSIFVILLCPLLLVLLIVWWLRMHKEPESTLMGKTTANMPQTKASSPIQIPPEALAAPPQPEPPNAPAAVTPPAVIPPTVSEPTNLSFAATGEPPVKASAPIAVAAPAAPVEVTPPAAPIEIEAPTAPATPDDLKRLEGIGPKVAGLLQTAGIVTFAQLAETDVVRLREILDAAKLPFLDPTTWPEQAALAAKGDWEAFEKLTGELKGGRRVS